MFGSAAAGFAAGAAAQRAARRGARLQSVSDTARALTNQYTAAWLARRDKSPQLLHAMREELRSKLAKLKRSGEEWASS